MSSPLAPQRRHAKTLNDVDHIKQTTNIRPTMHPAIWNLLKAHAASRFRRFANAFSSPRRIALSCVVVLLGCVWLGQTVASVLLREPWEPEVFRRWVALPLMGYFAWHIVRVAWKRPDEAIEWLPEEEALVVGGPFTRTQILTYRVAIIFTSTLPKALLTTLVLWPDMSWSGPIGMLLALVFLELFRLVMDLSTNCLSARAYAAFRAVTMIAAVSIVYSGHQHAQQRIATSTITDTVPVPMSQQAMAAMQSMRHGPIMSTLEPPFLLVADIISGRGSNLQLLLKITSLLAIVLLTAGLIVKLDVLWRHCQIIRERNLWQPDAPAQHKLKSDQLNDTSRKLPKVPFFSGMGPLIWRQFKGAWRYAGSLLVSMGIPALLSCLPLFSIPNPQVAFVSVVCGVLFYTFVLLPEAIKFDFRLDSDHLCQIRMLPLTSTQVVVGQLATPVILACLFQIAVICFAGCVRNAGASSIICASAVTLPLTVIFVAIDNLVFLLYPHRPTQEGFEAFLRTILKFTGKSLLLGIAGASLLLWAPLSATIARQAPQLLTTPSVFYAGLSLGIGVLAFGLVQLVVRAYNQFDVSLDVA